MVVTSKNLSKGYAGYTQQEIRNLSAEKVSLEIEKFFLMMCANERGLYFDFHCFKKLCCETVLKIWKGGKIGAMGFSRMWVYRDLIVEMELCIRLLG